ncbi:uncharacterized protein FIBRA_02559 [Fibroporia radiculosa]|uniref:F-box domain-containing protein n=1 Tax=Fibroporia radiculosa TaxID=599839 RepID=J4GMZ2_9APHY|nr:uncharacterized protein FIBRA_02559 [Fibroporia radiculosa]CCM00525.1 predicted protein [Fibroporia radiculosa]
MTQFLDLNDDVLDAIVSHLTVTHALHLACACRRVHDIAMRRALSRVTIFNQRKRFMKFAACMLSDISYHVIYLRKVHISLFGDVGETDFSSAVRLLTHVLRRAKNIQSLGLGPMELMIASVPAVADAVCGMENLEALWLYNGGQETILMLDKIQSRLERLVVHSWSDRLTTDAPQVLPLIAHIQSLQSLGLHNLTFQDEPHPHAIWRNVRILRLESCRAAMPVFVHSFPTIRALHLKGNDRRNPQGETVRCWPSLDELSVNTVEDLLEWPITCPVRCVSYEALIQDPGDAEQAFVQIKNVKPIVLSLSILNSFSDCWAEVARSGHRLRAITVTLVNLYGSASRIGTPNYSRWMQNVLPVLGRSQIMFLRIIIPGSLHTDRLVYEKCPEQIMKSIPSLRCLGFGDKPSTMCWWRIVTNRARRRELKQISEAAGMRVLEYISSETFEMSTVFDESLLDIRG